MGIISKIQSTFQTKTVRYTIPFLVFIVGGSFILQEFSALKYKYNRKTTRVYEEELQKMGIDISKKMTIEQEYEKLQEKDLDHWENKRIPRPWEEMPQVT